MKKPIVALPLLVALAGALLLPAACSSTIENRAPVGEAFPSVVGTSLEGREVRIPQDFAGTKVLLLIGYEMETQFDLDRWLVGLMQMGISVKAVEVPTIEGLVPGMFSGMIDDGMRSGIPLEDWASVVTVYGDAGDIVSFTGNENPRNGRIVLLDEKGQVIWYHDRGFSPRFLAKVQELVAVK